MLTRLIDQGSGHEFDGIEVADREAIQPRLALARVAAKARSASVPLRDVDAVGAALTEEQGRHRTECSGLANNKQNGRESAAFSCSRLSQAPERVEAHR